MLLGLIGWTVIGLIVGFIATKFVNLRGDDPRLSIGVACGGAIFAGLFHALFISSGASSWNPWGLVFAAVGAVAGAVTWHLVRSRYSSKARYVPRRSY